MPQVTIDQAMRIALQHHQLGHLQQAEVIYRQILLGQPAHAEALYRLGVIAHQVGRIDIAVDLIRGAVAAAPGHANAHNSLGAALKDGGRLDEAIAAYRQAIALAPGHAQALNNLGIALTVRGRPEEAVAACRQAIAARPGYAEAHYNLGNALKDTGQLDEAIAAYRQAISLRPNLIEAHNNLGNALNHKGLFNQAIAAHRQTVALNPNSAGAHGNLGASLESNGQLDEAIAAYRQAVALAPESAMPHYNLALALLARGDYEQGWEEHEWRWKWKDFPSPPRNFTQPPWEGGPLADRTILLHAEQGFGDAIQFIRYLPLVERLGGNIVIECQPELGRLLRTARYPIVARGQPLPAFDLHCPLLSLPRVFATTPRSIPARVPYIFPDPALLDSWRQRLAVAGAVPAGHRVALAWAGSPAFKADRTRSIALDRLAPLAGVRGATFYSLQKGEAGRQADEPPAGLRLANLGPQLHDFADTAAVMCLMDLIITTDTSVAHLAGALGRPVWVMLQFVPDWRWFGDRQRSAWYPSMRLFRQPSRGDWDSVIRRVVEELAHGIEDGS